MRIGFFLFPQLTQLDFTGPYEVLARLPEAQVQLIALNPEPITTELGLRLLPDTLCDDVSELDVLVVPGGPGINKVLACRDSLGFLTRVRATWVTSVCTGSLVLGKAGLLQGYRATTHWCYLELLSLVGATPVSERVVTDRNRITAAGVSAGLEFGFELARRLTDDRVAGRIQCGIEYDPSPPPPWAPEDREAVWERNAAQREERRRLLE